jgi:hypothetical protein
LQIVFGRADGAEFFQQAREFESIGAAAAQLASSRPPSKALAVMDE